MANRRGKQANPGAELRAIRQQLGWSMREVHTASLAVSTKHRQPAFVIPRTDFHCDDFGRSALCSIFRTTLNVLKTTATLLVYRPYCVFRA
jgi:hypothetical protein